MQSSEGATPHGGNDAPIVAEPLADHSASEEHIHLPPPTIWPVTTAFGVALAGLGLVSTLPLTWLGIVVMLYGVSQWVQELRHEPH